MPRLTGILQRTVWAGLSPISSTAWAPCLGRKGEFRPVEVSRALTDGLRTNTPCPAAVTLFLLILSWPKIKCTLQEWECSPTPFQLPHPSAQWDEVGAELWWSLTQEVFWGLCVSLCRLHRQSRPYFSRNLLCFNILKNTCTYIRDQGSFH